MEGVGKMRISDILKDFPNDDLEISGALVVFCTEGTPIILRTMEDEEYKELLKLLNDVNLIGTIQ